MDDQELNQMADVRDKLTAIVLNMTNMATEEQLNAMIVAFCRAQEVRPLQDRTVSSGDKTV